MLRQKLNSLEEKREIMCVINLEAMKMGKENIDPFIRWDMTFLEMKIIADYEETKKAYDRCALAGR